MADFVVVFMSFVWVLFPIMIYLIYDVYVENTSKEKNNLVFTFCLLSSFYLLIRFSFLSNQYFFTIIVDLIVLLFYIKGEKKIAFLISTIVIYMNFNLYVFIVIFKYLLYFIFSFVFSNRKYLISTFFTGIFCLILYFSFSNIEFYSFLLYLFYYGVVYFIIVFLIKAEKIVEINISYKELMKENQLRESLFKISHEIKNPIAVCKGYLDMFDTNNMSHFERYIPIIKSEINKTLNLLQDFSACNKIRIECDIIDITMLLLDIMDNFKLLFDDKNIDFDFDIIDDEVFIYGDYNRLNQVFLNIIKNSIEAIDYCKKSDIKVFMELTSSDVKVFIEDNGVGISEDDMDKISEPFFTTKQNGTGLGVLLSKEIISAHNGSLNYVSTLGVGTTVIITLPLYKV